MNRRVAFYDNFLCLGIFWVIGILVGIVFAHHNSPLIAPNNLGDIFMPPSFGGLVLSSVLPVCFVILFNRIGLRFALYLILVIDGFLIGFCSLYLSNVLNCPVFYVRTFYMFAQSCCSTILLVLCSLLTSGVSCRLSKISFLSIIVSVIISVFDYLVFIK